MPPVADTKADPQLATKKVGPLSFAIATPSFNQARYIEQTIRSVLDQQYSPMEYLVADAGSTDGSVEILRRYEERLTGWSSEPDEGHFDAINKSFSRTKGEIMGWINSDDQYVPWTFRVVAEIMAAHPQIEWLTSRIHLFAGATGTVVHAEEHPGFSRQQIMRGGTLPGCGWPAWAFVQQEATFWRRSLWDRAGGHLKHKQYPLAADFDLWMRFAAQAELYCVDVPLAIFRRHADQKTSQHMEAYLNEARQSFRANGGRPPGPIKSFWLKKSAKLLRFFLRRHAYATAQQGGANHVSFDTGAAGWTVGDR